jgi:hypothetical protein
MPAKVSVDSESCGIAGIFRFGDTVGLPYVQGPLPRVEAPGARIPVYKCTVRYAS